MFLETTQHGEYKWAEMSEERAFDELDAFVARCPWGRANIYDSEGLSVKAYAPLGQLIKLLDYEEPRLTWKSQSRVQMSANARLDRGRYVISWEYVSDRIMPDVPTQIEYVGYDTS